MAEALSSAADQHAALARFVENMSPPEADALRMILDQHEEAG